MVLLNIDQRKCNQCGMCISSCPFKALQLKGGRLEVNSRCRLCGICIERCPNNALSLPGAEKETKTPQNTGVMVIGEIEDGELHPVTLELIGKAGELTEKTKGSVSCVLLGPHPENLPHHLLKYGVRRIYKSEHPKLRYFRAEAHTEALVRAIKKENPAIVLLGATPTGRSLAPRVATRLRTGLTADCTRLEVREKGELVQIRPAFGGDIMARIITPNHRPQMATVRYRVMEKATPRQNSRGEIIDLDLTAKDLEDPLAVRGFYPKPRETDLTEADVIVAAGRGVKKPDDLDLLRRLAESLNGQLGASRPLIEAGWLDQKQQIGLSGRTVRPKLLITAGISGAVQFIAGIGDCENIFAINKDKNAPIFSTAHYGLVGDLYNIVPRLLNHLQKGGKTGVL